MMTDSGQARRYRFGAFEADASTGELRRQGIRIKLHAQPFQVLLMLLERPGEVLSREEISRALWSDGTFVDYDHGVNSAVNRIREALGDTANSPRFVETLARRGYRFLAPVEAIAAEADRPPATVQLNPEQSKSETEPTSEAEPRVGNGILASLEELPETSPTVVQTLFLLLQLMYLGFYVGTLTNLSEIEELLSTLPRATLIVYGLIGTAAILIPVRAFVFCAALFRAPGMRGKFLKMWPWLLVADVLWALSPFLLLHHISIGLALACMALLVYSPFAQRALMLMGAGRQKIAHAAMPR
ncbi:MAG TPA: winged helix-turn-helix domain-containing protein [Terracidiphilus sp.]|nr:winged helix-turn-helix domain-containing protein [Terracidiphilus sp.]